MNYQWYPGHMTKAKRQMVEDIKLIDLIIEIVDARIPLASRNPDIDDLAKNKSRIVLLNKCDLADSSVNKQWISYFENQNILCRVINSKAGMGIKNISNLIKEACAEKIERDRRRGIKNRPVRAMIVGIPNVGKSTFINSFAGKNSAKTGNKPGVTKGKQWIKVSKEIELLDTPGILWPKFEDNVIGMKLAFIGSINDEIMIHEELALDFIHYMRSIDINHIYKAYDIEPSDDDLAVLNNIAVKRGCLMKDNAYDIVKASKILMDDFRNGKLGMISLETPERDVP